MTSLKKPQCSVCATKLTQYELSDNIYLGLSEISYICYSCQTISEPENDLNYDDEDDDNF